MKICITRKGSLPADVYPAVETGLARGNLNNGIFRPPL